MAYIESRNNAGSIIGQPIDVLITPHEINDLHGTGPLVKRVLKGKNKILCIRAESPWNHHDFGDWNVCIPQEISSRVSCFHKVLSLLKGANIQNVLCVPFLPADIMTAIVIQSAFNARLCTWVMDDQNIACSGIPDYLMKDAIDRSSLRLATHPELRDVYEQKYQRPFHILPAVAPSDVSSSVQYKEVNQKSAALIGSFWSQQWFDLTCHSLEGSGLNIDWYGNNKSPWVNFEEKQMSKSGITAHGVVPEDELCSELQRCPFSIVPTSPLNDSEDNIGIARLSLPGRILFSVATAGKPVLLLGSDKTCGARFVKHFGVGVVSSYEKKDIRAAVKKLTNLDSQATFAKKCLNIKNSINDAGVSDWFYQSLDLGAPVNNRFENLFSDYSLDDFPHHTAINHL